MSVFDIEGEVMREYALGGEVDYLDEMEILYNKYVDEHSDFNYGVEADDRKVFINFDSIRCSTEIEISRDFDSVDTWAEPFDWVHFNNVSLANIVLRSDVAWADEYFLATYWGKPATTDMKEFVRDNVRILQKYYVPSSPNHKLPDSAVDEESFDTTDVRTYTDTAGPVPWARGSIMVLYENDDVCEKILNHEECRLSGDRASAPYPVRE